MATLSIKERGQLNAEAQARRQKHQLENDYEPSYRPAKRFRTSPTSVSIAGSSSFLQSLAMVVMASRGPATLTKSSRQYLHGALRLSATRGRIDETPGRRKSNTVRPEHLIHSDLVSGFFTCLQYGSEEWLRYLDPLSRAATIYHSCHLRYDCLAGPILGSWPATVQPDNWYHQKIALVQQAYQRRFGPNFHAVYSLECAKGALPHSKIMLLVYPNFLRFVVTSSNYMEVNFSLSDNTWYFQDFPPRQANHVPTPEADEFQSQLFAHIEALGAPPVFTASIRNRYDLNGLKVALILSERGTYGGPQSPGLGEDYGLLRLNSLVRANGYRCKLSKLVLNSCTGSTGHLKEDFMRAVHQAACGRLDLEPTTLKKDMVVIVYPTWKDVQASPDGEGPACEQSSIKAAEWPKTSDTIKGMFHHYSSKDTGRLFHNKQIFPTRKDRLGDPPRWMVVGSANLSTAAWGEVSKWMSEDPDDPELEIENYI
ncbi:tyrosyl-DNA phosphodiesterase-domain-containing protein [Mycena floridula]|nr:tyrosyl-DNA phosphodiesterase-domain-containing protein [Mycena floridula]